MARHALVVGLAFSITATVATLDGCGGQTPLITAPAPVPTSLSVTGNASLTAVGQTSALTGMVTYSDGSVRDFTSQITWSSSRPSVATVSGGVVLATGLGQTSISAGLSKLSRIVNVKVTPPGTFTVSGRVREPGTGDLTDVQVVELASGQSALSDVYGYSLGGLTSGHLTFDKTGYEPVQVEATPGGINDVPMQSIVRMGAGASIPGVLAPHDMDYIVDGNQHCYPCKLIRISTATGTLHLQLTWSEPHSMLGLWAAGNVFRGTQAGPSTLAADVSVSAGEVVVYVGKISSANSPDYVMFTLATTSGVAPLVSRR